MATINGSGGDDTLAGTGEDDTILGDEGSDTIAGGHGVDVLTGGAGRDVFRFGTRDCRKFCVWGRTMLLREPSYAATQTAPDLR
jgi:hypothetical protein